MSRRVWLVLAVVLVACTVTAYGGYRLWSRFHVEQVSLANAVVRNLVVGGQDARIISGPGSGVRPLALVMHGYRSDERVLQEPYMAAFTQELVDAGWVVAASEAHGDAWGSAESQAAHVALYEHVSAAHEVGDVVLVSVSMGAVSGLNILASEAIPGIDAWVGINPVTDLESMAKTDQWREPISEALSPVEVVGLNPLTLDYPDVPMTVYASEGDSYTPYEMHALPFAAGTDAVLVDCDGGHISPACFQAGDMLSR